MVPMAPSSTRMRSPARRRNVCSVEEGGADITTGSALLPLPEGERGGVRGFGSMLVNRAQNLFQHPVHIARNVVIPESKDEIAHGLQHSRSIRIACLVVIMLTAIKLHDELGVRAEEIDDEAIDRHLPLEFPSGQTA